MADIASLEQRRARFTSYITRSGCAPCDRSEAGYQISIINRKIDTLHVALRVLIS